MCQDNTYIRFDWAIKHILRDKANFDILEGFISVLLGEEIKIEELLESESNQDSDTDKFNRVDIKAKEQQWSSDNRGSPVDETAVLPAAHTLRNMQGHHRAHLRWRQNMTRSRKSTRSASYTAIMVKAMIMCIMEKRGSKGIHTGNDLLVNIKEEGVIVPHLPREVFPEYYLARVNVYDKIPETPLDEWMTYLKTGR